METIIESLREEDYLGMKVSKAIIAAIGVLCLCSQPSVAAIGFRAPGADELLEAPIVIYGYIESTSEPRPNEFLFGEAAKDQRVWTATVRAELQIKGSVAENTFTIQQSLRAGPAYNTQLLDSQSFYVLFLTNSSDQQEFVGVNKHHFGLKSNEIVVNEISGQAPREALRVIARSNVYSSNEEIAALWAQVVSDLYEKKDMEFFQQQLSNEHLAVRGTAIAALCEHGTGDAALYDDLMRFMEDSTPPGSLAVQMLRRKAVISFVESAKGSDLDRNRLRTWMASEAPELTEAAIRFIKETRNETMLPELIDLMRESSNLYLQYDCFAAICAIDGNPGPGFRTFVSNSEPYIQELLERHTSAQNSD